MKCKICEKEVERKYFYVHLRIEHNNMKMKEYYINCGYDFANEEILKKEYYDKQKSLKQITKESEEKYNISNLRPIILEFAKDFEIQKRSISEANKNYLSKGNEVWNKGKTKENSSSVKKYANKKKDLYKKVHKKLHELSIKEILEFNVQQNKKIRKILREKIIKKQGEVCPICKKNFSSLIDREKHIHHIDRDNSNDTEENLVVLCSACHMKISAHKWRLIEIEEFNNFEKFIKNSDKILEAINKIKKKRPSYKSYSNYRDVKYLNCELCNNEDYIHIHHLDGDPENNEKNNLMFLCVKCHGLITGFNIIVSSKEDLKKEFDKKQKNRYNKNEYYNNTKRNGKCSKKISKLKLKEFIQ